MTQETTKKAFPPATAEIARLFGLNEESAAASHAETGAGDSHETGHAPAHLPVADLPVAHAAQHAAEEEKSAHGETAGHDSHGHGQSAAAGGSSRLLGALKAALPYLAIFGIGIFLYFFFFSSVDFSGLLKLKSNTVQNPKQTALAALESQNMDAYRQWINQFYYDVSDDKILDPNADNSGNGLSNFQKFLLNLNPKSYDTLGLGMSDSDALARGVNPLSGTNLNDTQKNIVSTYFDMETISNKQAIARLQKAGQVAGATTFGVQQASASTDTPAAAAYGQDFSQSARAAAQDGASFDNSSNSAAAAAAKGAQQGYQNDPEPVFGDLDIDTSVPARLEIPSLKINAPIMWSRTPDDFDKDLQSGVIHYPGTALPGQIGTSYISGHSSNYVWAKGNYNHVFTYLDNLNTNDSFKITVVQKNGKDAILHYLVTGKQQYKPDDIAQFQNGGKSVVALSTCWPVGSTAKRLVVFGELAQVEK